MTTVTAGAAAPRRLSFGRWNLLVGVVLALIAAYVVILIGVQSQVIATDTDVVAQAQEQFINALTIGAIYALIALGYTMVYGIIELINFAHGEVFMVGSFVCWWLLT